MEMQAQAPVQGEMTAQGDGQEFTDVFIKNLDKSIKKERLEEEVIKFGSIKSINMPKEGNKDVREGEEVNKGYAFVYFEDSESAKRAVDGLNGAVVFGQKLHVERALSYQERQDELKSTQDRNLHVNNLDKHVTEEILKQIFNRYGKIISVKIEKKENGQSKGFGFVMYSSKEEAAKAIAEVSGRFIGSKKVYVNLAQRKEDRKVHLANLRLQGQNGHHGFQPRPGNFSCTTVLSDLLAFCAEIAIDGAAGGPHTATTGNLPSQGIQSPIVVQEVSHPGAIMAAWLEYIW